MFKSKLEVKGMAQAANFFKTGKAQLNNPSPESKRAVFRYMDDTIFPRRFNDQKNPAGGKWKPSKRVLKHGGMTLTDKRFLRNSMYSSVYLVHNGQVNIDMFAKGKLQKIKAAVHNNGLRIRNRGGGLTKMPKRQFAWISKSEKEKIVYDLFLKALEK